MEMIKLKWNINKGEGTVKILDQFKDAYTVLQIDALDDWIVELTDLRDSMLSKEDQMTKEVLWGRE